MEITYFREFVVLAKTQNYWSAAEQLHIGQPSLSKHIKTLETQLGSMLFERTSRRVELTEFGKLMLPYAQAIARMQYEYETAAFNFLQTGKEVLRIASIPVLAQYNITDILVRFQLDFPNVQIDLQEADTNLLIDRLLERKCDLIFYRDSELYRAHDMSKEAQLVKVPYQKDHLIAVLPRDHPLAEEPQIELSQLSSEYFALIKSGSMPYNLCMRACEEAGFVPQVLFSSHRLESVMDMVTKGSCVALLFANHITFPRYGTDGMPFVSIPIAPPIETTIYLAYRRDEALSPTAARFVEHCRLPL